MKHDREVIVKGCKELIWKKKKLTKKSYSGGEVIASVFEEHFFNGQQESMSLVQKQMSIMY